MNLRKICSVYAFGIGFSIIGLWIMLLSTNQVPELNTTPIEIGFHITAEFIAASLHIFAGIGLWKTHGKGETVFFVASGAVIYAMINAAGYYVEQTQWTFVIMFLILTCFSMILSYSLWKHPRPSINT